VRALEQRPEVPEHLEDYWYAYTSLSATRAAGATGPAPILHSEIKAYAELHGWQQEDAVILAFFVRRLDNRYFERLNDRRKASEAKRGNSQGGDRRPRGNARRR
jgi:hypothetical protein